MQIKTWSNFSKRVNSTKQPLNSAATTKDVTLKDMCDILAPSFILNTTDFDINYVQAFGNYYYAQCINLDGHRTEIKCSLDHLATFKTQIGGYTGLIEYASASSNVYITDPRNMPTLELERIPTDLSWNTGAGLSANSGTYILSYISDQSGTSGLVKYAAMDWYALAEFSNNLFTQTIYEEVKKQFTNLTNSLVSLTWLPLDYNDLTGTVTSNLTVGSQAITLTDSQAKILSDRVHNISTANTALSYPSVNLASVKNTYLAKAPYMTAQLYLPYVGHVELSDDLLAQYDYLQINGAVDVFTGDIVYGLNYGAMRLASYSGNCATHLPIGSASYNAYGVASGSLITMGGIGAAVLGFATGNPIMGLKGLASAAGGAAATAKSLSVQSQINGSLSSGISQELGTVPKVIMIESFPVERDILAYKTVHGMPYFQVSTISSLGGYVQCADASVSIPGDGAEQDTVNSYLNAGIYYE